MDGSRKAAMWLDIAVVSSIILLLPIACIIFGPGPVLALEVDEGAPYNNTAPRIMTLSIPAVTSTDFRFPIDAMDNETPQKHLAFYLNGSGYSYLLGPDMFHMEGNILVGPSVRILGEYEVSVEMVVMDGDGAIDSREYIVEIRMENTPFAIVKYPSVVRIEGARTSLTVGRTADCDIQYSDLEGDIVSGIEFSWRGYLDFDEDYVMEDGIDRIIHIESNPSKMTEEIEVTIGLRDDEQLATGFDLTVIVPEMFYEGDMRIVPLTDISDVSELDLIALGIERDGTDGYWHEDLRNVQWDSNITWLDDDEEMVWHGYLEPGHHNITVEFDVVTDHGTYNDRELHYHIYVEEEKFEVGDREEMGADICLVGLVGPGIAILLSAIVSIVGYLLAGTIGRRRRSR